MVKMAVEVGGTFTDAVWLETDGTLKTLKVPSTPPDPSQGVVRALTDALGERLSAMSVFLHGSTVATNAVLERKGAATAFVTTRGFGDVLVAQRQLRRNVYAIVCDKVAPLIPRDHVVEVAERLSADGRVVSPLDEAGVVDDVRRLVEHSRIEALGVCLLHAYADATHERRVRELIAEAFPEVTVILSSDVLPTFREYERASTTAMCAYVAHAVDRYVGRVEGHLAAAGVAAPLFIMQSSGGVLPAEGIRQRPIEMLNSGPAAGVIGAVRVGRQVGHDEIITFDMGGTSTDVCLVTAGAPTVTSGRLVDGLPVGVPGVDITNVGSGGGSIGWIDAGGMLRVGPRSAGEDPGPASYGRGGHEPTLTDAVAHLGWLRAEHFLGGKMSLHEEKAAAALAGLASPLGVSTRDIAQSIVDIAVDHNSNAVRIVSTRRGFDPQNYALFAYGGMGPVLGALVAEHMRIQRVVVPPHPGLFSALGLLLADLERTYQRTVFLPVNESVTTRLRAHFEWLRAAALEELGRYGHAADDVVIETWLDMRYVGQGFELLVPVDLELLASRGDRLIISMFHEAHRQRYGTTAPTDAMEVVNCRLVARVRNADEIELRSSTRRQRTETDVVPVLFGGEQRDCLFARRDTMPQGYVGTGLMVIEEPTATTLVPPGWDLSVGASGVLILQRAA